MCKQIIYTVYMHTQTYITCAHLLPLMGGKLVTFCTVQVTATVQFNTEAVNGVGGAPSCDQFWLINYYQHFLHETCLYY